MLRRQFTLVCDGCGEECEARMSPTLPQLEPPEGWRFYSVTASEQVPDPMLERAFEAAKAAGSFNPAYHNRMLSESARAVVVSTELCPKCGSDPQLVADTIKQKIHEATHVPGPAFPPLPPPLQFPG